jgi:1L-myo-inositol 1-phosphate cytidylyltransferase
VSRDGCVDIVAGAIVLTGVARAAVILAAGLGSRLAAVGGGREEYSKPLMSVGGQTLLERTVGCCRAAGIERVVVVTGFRAELVAAEVKRLDRGDLETVHNAAWQKANGLSLWVCRERLAEPFALMMSDHLFDPSILSDMAAAEAPEGSVTLAVDSKIGSIFDLDDATKVEVEGGRIVAIGKQLERYNAIDCGLFLCTPAIFAALGEARAAGGGDCSLSEAMQIIGSRGQFLPFDIGARWWQDVDTPEMLAHATAMLERIEAGR